MGRIQLHQALLYRGIQVTISTGMMSTSQWMVALPHCTYLHPLRTDRSMAAHIADCVDGNIGVSASQVVVCNITEVERL